MDSVNWDQVADDADNSPRSVLAEVLGMADDIEDVVIVIRTNANRGDSLISYRSVSTGAMELALLEWAKYDFMREMERA